VQLFRFLSVLIGKHRCNLKTSQRQQQFTLGFLDISLQETVDVTIPVFFKRFELIFNIWVFLLMKSGIF